MGVSGELVLDDTSEPMNPPTETSGDRNRVENFQYEVPPQECCMKNRRICIPVVLCAVIGGIAVVVIAAVIIWKATDTEPRYLTFEPRVQDELIHIEKGNLNSYKDYVDVLAKVVNSTGNSSIGQSTLCSASRGFGYPDGHPCVLLILKPDTGWHNSIKAPNVNTVEGFRKNLSTLPDDSGRYFGVACSGMIPGDHKNIPAIQFDPPHGFLINPESSESEAMYLFAELKQNTSGEVISLHCQVATSSDKKYYTDITIMVD